MFIFRDVNRLILSGLYQARYYIENIE
jgi:hypothetical protein